MNTLIETRRPARHAFRLDAMLASATVVTAAPPPALAAPPPPAPPEATTRGPAAILLANRWVWLPPLLAEYCVLGCSVALSWFFLSVVQGQSPQVPLTALAVACVGFGGLSLWTRLRELFMPRPVILFGILVPMVACVVLLVAGVIGSRWAGEPMGLAKRGVILLPLLVFLTRGHLILQGARFAPCVSSLDRHTAKPAEMWVQLKRSWSFWLS